MPLHVLLTTAHFVIVALAMLHALMTERRPEKTMAWMLVLLFLPIIGLLLYIYFGIDTRRKRHIERQAGPKRKKTIPPPYEAAPHSSHLTPHCEEAFTAYTSGLDFFRALLADIGHARHSVYIDIYILADDALGRLLADSLIDRARQGISVRIVYDDVGSWTTRQRFFRRMQAAGIQIVPFLPVRLPFFTSKANYRNHRKLIAIDEATAYIGGMNIAMRYLRPNWRDTMLRIEGPAAEAIARTALDDWRFAAGIKQATEDKANHSPLPTGTLLTSSPTDPYPEIMQSYLRIIITAKSYVYIQTPYFLPTEPIAVALRTAALSGIDVRLMVPRQNDARVIEWASRSYLRDMARAGVRIGLYEPAFLHAKTLIADDDIASCGSANIDIRSFESNFESTLFITDKERVATLRDIFNDDWQRCTDFATLHYLVRPTFTARLTESLARLLTPLL